MAVLSTSRIRLHIQHLDGVLPFIEEEYILSMSAKPRKNLPSQADANFCRYAQKMQVTTFVTRA